MENRERTARSGLIATTARRLLSLYLRASVQLWLQHKGAKYSTTLKIFPLALCPTEVSKI